MLGPCPMTIANDLLGEIRESMSAATVYASVSDFKVKYFLHQADKLANADAYQAFVARALIHTLVGNSDEAFRCVKNAKHLGRGRAQWLWVYELNVFENLGYFSKAAGIFKENAEVAVTDESFVAAALSCGAFDYVSSAFAGFPVANTDIGHAGVKLAERCVMSLQKVGLSQEHVQKVLDLAGDVMRRHRIFPSSTAPLIHAYDDGLLYQLPVPVNAEASAQMTDEVVSELIERELDLLEFSFRFVPFE